MNDSNGRRFAVGALDILAILSFVGVALAILMR
jgi:hypothetical protein